MKLPKSLQAPAAAFAALLAVPGATALTATPADAQTNVTGTEESLTINGITLRNFNDGYRLDTRTETLIFVHGGDETVDFVRVIDKSRNPNNTAGTDWRQGTPQFQAAADRAVGYMHVMGITQPDGSPMAAVVALDPQTGQPLNLRQGGQPAPQVNLGSVVRRESSGGAWVTQMQGGWVVSNNDGSEGMVVTNSGQFGRFDMMDRNGQISGLQIFQPGSPDSVAIADRLDQIAELYQRACTQEENFSGDILSAGLRGLLDGSSRGGRIARNVGRDSIRLNERSGRAQCRAIAQSIEANVRVGQNLNRDTARAQRSAARSGSRANGQREAQQLAQMTARATPSRTDRAMLINGQWQVCDTNSRGVTTCSVPTVTFRPTGP